MPSPQAVPGSHNHEWRTPSWSQQSSYDTGDFFQGSHEQGGGSSLPGDEMTGRASDPLAEFEGQQTGYAWEL